MEDLEELERSMVNAEQAFEEGDLETYFALAHEDATVFFSGNAPPLYGKASFKEYILALVEQLESWDATSENRTWKVFGDTAISFDEITIKARLKNDSEINTTSRRTITYVRQDGKWLYVLVHYSPLE